MRFRLNGEWFEVDPEIARVRILSSIPDPVQTHWVEVDGRRWPVKQALEAATGIPRGACISHRAVDLLSKLGFQTSEIPGRGPSAPDRLEQAQAERRVPISAAEAADAFALLDRALQDQPLTITVGNLEARLAGADADSAARVAEDTALDHQLIEACPWPG